MRLGGTPIEGRRPREISAPRRGLRAAGAQRLPHPAACARTSRWAATSSPPARAERIDAIFARFPLLAERRRHAARTLSGGQRQILAMAMALMVAPSLLLLDEPSAGLAPMAAERLFETIGAINRDGVAIVMVEQNALEALAIAGRGYILVDGRNSRTGAAARARRRSRRRRIFLGA